MSEKTVRVKRIKCDLCSFEQHVEVKDRLLAKPKTPDTWGHDLMHKDQMCPTCHKKYKQGYSNWYSDFKQQRKSKNGEQ